MPDLSNQAVRRYSQRIAPPRQPATAAHEVETHESDFEQRGACDGVR